MHSPVKALPSEGKGLRKSTILSVLSWEAAEPFAPAATAMVTRQLQTGVTAAANRKMVP
jgi:hypothetical protein